MCDMPTTRCNTQILPYILLPLAGPEELSEEDMEGMPDDLQYLPEDKLREPDPKLRLMLIETLTQVFAQTLIWYECVRGYNPARAS